MVGKQLGRQAYRAAYAQAQKLMAAGLVGAASYAAAATQIKKQKLPHGRACSSLSKNNDETPFRKNYLPRCQMSRLYSAMVRSEENIPALAMFTRHLRRQPRGSQA